MEKSYRIKANLGVDQVLNVNIKQDIDLYEVLSLRLRREDVYRLHASNYGVIVGRVLANDAFGVPNAKVSVFIPISDEDSLRGDISQLYPYTSTRDQNDDNIRYNTLPNYSKGDCHVPVGTFPKKQLVLDDDSVLEVYDKYYKYTTITNKSGDYMIFGVPSGEHTLHVDVDLSDIGILSQKPRDFLYKGYSISMFDSPTQFKSSTNLDNLAQIISQDAGVNVYPFWGDSGVNQIAVTRKDINLQYEFNTYCVFMGSVMTDNEGSIGHSCIPDEKSGDASQLVPSEGTIEMIRKTPDGRVEEFPIQGNQLIDGNGVFCYQIPMNLDYVGMDEYGNIVPTDNPTKGIATRTRVRFRISLTENAMDATNVHTAKYLVPNNPMLDRDEIIPHISKEHIKEDFDYNFGTKTPDDQYRDLYWNKVYSIKSYIPRVQRSKYEKTVNYTGLKGINKKEAKKHNLIPYNRLNLNFKISPFKILQTIGDDDNKIKQFFDFLRANQIPYDIQTVREAIIDELDALGLDFYNDWLNGCLYFPKWFWKVTQKKKIKKGKSAFNSEYCECKKEPGKKGRNSPYIYTTWSCPYEMDFTVGGDNLEADGATMLEISMKYIFSRMLSKISTGSQTFGNGLVKKVTNKDNAELYYYSFGTAIDDEETNDLFKYVRLFSTDIILLGSLNDCDIDGIPQMISDMPPTTCIIPPMGRAKYVEGTSVSNDAELHIVDRNGMSWGSAGGRSNYGLFFGIEKGMGVLQTIQPVSDEKSLLNSERICELGVDNEIINTVGGFGSSPDNMKLIQIGGDGLIDKDEIVDDNSRTLFATLNSNRLIGLVPDEITGYNKYLLLPFNVNNFDGKFKEFAHQYGTLQKHGVDAKCIDYVDFRMGSRNFLTSSAPNEFFNNIYCGDKRHFYAIVNEHYFFPLYENSFYFYFGMIPGSTAIDRLYTEYFSDCSVKITHPFTLSVSDIQYEDACSEIGETHNASFKLNVGEIEMPYSVNIDGTTYGDGFASPILDVTGQTNGKHEVTVTDVNGSIISTTVNINYVAVSLNYEVVRHIGVEFNDDDCANVICNADTQNYGIIRFNSFILYGKKTDITSLTGSNGVYTVNSDDGRCVRIKITPTLHDTFSECRCSGSNCLNCTVPEISGSTPDMLNEVNIYAPDMYSVEIMEMCDGCSTETLNYAVYTANVNDTKDLEMYINDVPLKFLVGANENDITKYNPLFHDGNKVESVDDVKGWLKLHDPSAYKFDEIDSTKWFGEGVDASSPAEKVKKELESMFALAEGSYITTNAKGKQTIRLEGGDDSLLLRSCVPDYGQFSENSIEGSGAFSAYTIDGQGEVTCDKENPNIVSKNYRYVDSETLIPTSLVVAGDYGFNEKYNDCSGKSGNYFAGFTRFANLDDDCNVDLTLGEFKRLPYMADDLDSGKTIVNDEERIISGICKDEAVKVTNAKFSGLFDRLSKQQTNDHFLGSKDYYPYFRTEFVDRRLDYDLYYATPYKRLDFENGDEHGWWAGKIAGHVYNGIEMAYENNASKNIISDDSTDLEYTYNVSGDVTWNSSNRKRFYSSVIKVDGFDIDIKDVYYSDYNNGSDIIGKELYGGASVYYGPSSFPRHNFNNFGEDGSYPTTRFISVFQIPYSDTYTFETVSCSYNDLNINVTNDGVKVSAKPGEVVKHTIQTNSAIKLTEYDIEDAAINDKFNVSYSSGSGSGVMTLNSSNVHMDFTFNFIPSDGFRSKIGPISANSDPLYTDETYGVRLIRDDLGHNNMATIKFRLGVNNNMVRDAIMSNTIDTLNELNQTDFIDEISKKEYTLEGQTNACENVFVLIDRRYYSTACDSLTKKIRVFNLSTNYNTSRVDVKYAYLGKEEKGKQDFYGEGSSSSSGGSTSVEGTTDGKSYDKISISVKSHSSTYLFTELDKAAFSISYAGATNVYSGGDFEPSADTGDGYKNFVFLLTKNETLFENTTGDINIVAYLKTKNGFIYKLPFKFVVNNGG